MHATPPEGGRLTGLGSLQTLGWRVHAVSAARRRSSGQNKLVDAGARVLVPGVAMSVFGLAFNSHPMLGGAAKALLPLGLVLALIGALLLFVARRRVPVAQRVDPVGLAVTEPLHFERPPEGTPGSRPTRWSAAVFDQIEWRRFEAVVERLFQQAGFKTKSQSHGADGGVDVWLFSQHRPDEPASIVQCKHWAGQRVGVKVVRELRGVMASENVGRGQFATTSAFTDEAIEFARKNSINLLDGKRLLELIAQRSEAQQAELLAVALEGDYWRPTCASCGIKLARKEPRSGGKAFWGCPNFAGRRCRTRMEIRETAPRL
jgi:restriction system protein